mmetsp:Transcript_20947/g.71394  ORF Transcript_20947/g.71394 Transcript_20947/m.71394 type:complete len:286 (-) Transcript_20947:778-1635(-)
MEVLRTKDAMRSWSAARRAEGKTVGFVPTMGYLHGGHLSLVRGARERCDCVVVSLYVNPSQFAPHEDLDVYPRDPEGDRAKLEGLADAVFEPESLYEDGHETYVQVERMQVGLCGVSRPHFFRGVATVVAKLLNVVRPHTAVFGRKDYQQLQVVRRMVRDLDLDVDVVGLPLVREGDGLAMSSRNVRLSPAERQSALCISRSLLAAKAGAEGGGQRGAARHVAAVKEAIAAAGGEVDYVEAVHPSSLAPLEEVGPDGLVIAVAARFGSVRLLDNVEIGVPVPGGA